MLLNVNLITKSPAVILSHTFFCPVTLSHFHKSCTTDVLVQYSKSLETQ